MATTEVLLKKVAQKLDLITILGYNMILKNY